VDESIQQLRTQARQLAQGKAPTAIRYPPAFREAAVALVRPRLGPGVSVARVARDLGLAIPSLTRWCRPRPRPVLRPVTLTSALTPPARPPAGPVLLTPQGHRVEGLDLAALVAVLRALA
jgi:transposase